MLKDVGVRDFHETTPIAADGRRPLLVCFSHLRWDFVFQRPQHLMSRFAASHNVQVWEEPISSVPMRPHASRRAPSPPI